jgi:putative endonuclease
MSGANGGRVSLPGPAAAPSERGYYVYFLSTPARGLYLGVTNDLARRLSERRLQAPPGAATIAGAARLVYFEVITDFRRAIARKEQLEGWNRRRRWRLIQSVNPEWRDLTVSGER